MSRNAVAVETATVGDYLVFHNEEIPSWKVVVDGTIVAMGGFKEASDRLWAYLNVKDGELSATTGAVVALAVRRRLRQAGRDVFVTCDAKAYPNAWRLLALLGFKVTGETLNEMRVWKCPA